jgi:hypothetical protein
MDFDDLEDDINAVRTKQVAPKATYRDVCLRCGGTGRYNGSSSLGYQCFLCKGKGYREYKQSPEQRARAKTNAANRKAKKQAQNLELFEAANPDFKAWWTNSTFDFAISLREYVIKHGDLSDAQRASALRCIEKNKAYRAAKMAAAEQAQEVDLSGVQAVFERARKNGYHSPRISILVGEDGRLVLSRAPDHGANAGSIYLKVGDSYMGKVTGGKFYRSRDCSNDEESDIVAALRDPLGAAIKFGQRTGICSCCSRKLTNGESIELGIGPICREKFFG